jgi:hypothetical protein
MEKATNNVVVDVTTLKNYVPPQIEVVELEHHSMLLKASEYGARFRDVDREEW